MFVFVFPTFNLAINILFASHFILYAHYQYLLGHGSRQKDHTGQEESGYNSTLVRVFLCVLYVCFCVSYLF